MRPRPSHWLALVSIVVAVAASTAGAVELTLETPATVTIAPGGSFTIELAADNASMDLTAGLIARMTGLAGRAIATSGVSAPHYFVVFCGSTVCFGGLNSNDNAFFDSNDLTGGTYVAGDDDIALISAQSFSASGDGSLDPGIAGVFGSHDSTDVSLQLQDVYGPGTYDLTVESYHSYNGSTDLPDLVVTVIVTPEPGTPLLTGLGLLALATLRRRVVLSETRRASLVGGRPTR